MSELIVIGYDTPEKAEEARADLMKMAREYLVEVADAVVAVADKDGNVKLNQMVNLWTVGATGGAFWGLLVGMLFFNPLLGAAVGAGTGALSASRPWPHRRGPADTLGRIAPRPGKPRRRSHSGPLHRSS